VRRGTVIMLIVLTLLLAGAATWQILLASQDREPYPVPTSVAPSP
jgi:hypothetical protein